MDHAIPHDHNQMHHHHSHASHSMHVEGHHLLQVTHRSVGFRMYDPTAPFFKATRQMVRTIDDLSISVHAGEIVAVVGASGSGKTLLADCILGLFEPNALVTGQIWFNGERMDALKGLAQALAGQGRVQEALDTYAQALRLADKTGIYFHTPSRYNEIIDAMCILYLKNGQPGTARLFARKKK